jgi:uncharacterized protein
MIMKKRNNTIAIAAASIIILLSALAIANAITGNDDLENGIPMSYDTPEIIDGYQHVELYFINYEYKLVPENLIVGVPVRMEVDLDSVWGCMRAIMIPAFNVRQLVSENNNIVEFTPTRTGKFNILCSMNMGRGQFRVVEG